MLRLRDMTRQVSLAVLAVGLIITGILTLTVYSQMEIRAKEMLLKAGEARMERMEEYLYRYANITLPLQEQISNSKGQNLPTAAQIRAYVSMGPSIRSVQVVPAEGRALYYTDMKGIYDLSRHHDKRLKLVKEHVKSNRHLHIEPNISISPGLYGLITIDPVYIYDNMGETFWGYVYVVADYDSFVKSLGLASMENTDLLCGLTLIDEEGKNQEVYSNGDYEDDSIHISRNIYGDIWALYLRPARPWVPPEIIILIVITGFSISLAAAVIVGRNSLLHRRSSTDSLTGAWNRAAGREKVGDWIRDNPDLKALMLSVDIDDFKMVNDVYGHGAGDRALSSFVLEMKKTFGERALVIRNGGDEFNIFTPVSSLGDMIPILDDFSEKPHAFSWEGKEITFHISLGCATYPRQGNRYDILAARADYALYRAKMNGKARWTEFDDSMEKGEERTQLGFNLSDVSSHMPGAMMVARANEREDVLFANNSMVNLLECRNYEEFEDYTKNGFFAIIPKEDLEAMKGDINEQKRDEEMTNFISYHVISAKGRKILVEGFGKLYQHPIYGRVFYVYIWEKALRLSREK